MSDIVKNTQDNNMKLTFQKLYGKDISQVDVNTINCEVANEYLQKINNMLVVQETKKTMEGLSDNPMIRYFMGPYPQTVGDGLQYLENVVTASEEYDPDNNIPSKRALLNTLKAYNYTSIKRYFKISYSVELIKRAFTSLGNFGQFLADYEQKMMDSYNNELYQIIQHELLPNVPHSFYYDGSKAQPTDQYTGTQAAVIKFSGIMERATGIPTREFNMDARGRQLNYSPSWSDFCLIVSANTQNALITENLPKLFNEKYLDLTNDKFETVIKSKLMPDNTLYVVHKSSFQLLKRIEDFAAQAFPQSLSIFNFLHFWLIPALLPWGMAFKFVFDTVTDKNTVVASDTPSAPATVAISGQNAVITGLTMNATWNTDQKGPLQVGDMDYVVGRVISLNEGTVGDVVAETIFNKAGNSTGAKWRFAAETANLTKYAGLTNLVANTKTDYTIGDITVPKGMYAVQLFSYFDGTRSSSAEYVLDATKPTTKQ